MAILGLFLLSSLACISYQATLPAHVVEVYFVVDQVVVNRYLAERTESTASQREEKALQNLQADINYFITEMNHMYASLQPKGLNIALAKRKVDVLDYTLFTQNQEVDPGLKSFDAWLQNQNAYDTIQYDAAIYWTGYELVSSGDPSVAGYAHVGEVCSSGGTSSGIAEYDLTYHLAVVTAHELGHILGASHDGDATGYVMVPSSNANEPNRWDFSLCSKEAFDAVISKLSTNCLQNTSPESQVPSSEATTALLNPDSICRRAEEDQNSYMCRSANFYDNAAPKGDNVCRRIWCKDTQNTGRCTDAFSTDGLICDINKRCNDGICEDSPDGASGAVKSDCIWGDQAQVSFNTNYGPYQGDCAGFLDLMGNSICSNSDVESACCETCGDKKTGIEGCQYGDQYPSCNDYTQAQICDNYADICCLFCQGYRRKRSADQQDNTVVLDTVNITLTATSALTPKTDSPKAMKHHNEP